MPRSGWVRRALCRQPYSAPSGHLAVAPSPGGRAWRNRGNCHLPSGATSPVGRDMLTRPVFKTLVPIDGVSPFQRRG